MFANVRFSRAVQFNVFFNAEKGMDDRTEQHFNELTITWNSQKLNRALWKTKKFYDSRTVASEKDTCVGKAAAYVNKLYSGKWLTDEEFWVVIAQLTNVEFSDEYKAHGVRFEFSKGVAKRIGGDRRVNPRSLVLVSDKSGKGAVRVPVDNGSELVVEFDLNGLSMDERKAQLKAMRAKVSEVLVDPRDIRWDHIGHPELSNDTLEWMSKFNSVSDSDASGNE
jgi:hypothetical protein